MTYENPYGLGHERATEPGPDVEIRFGHKWLKRDEKYQSQPLFAGEVYRRPIKLQVGHRYVRRDGVVVRVVDLRLNAKPNYEYLCDDKSSRDINGNWSCSHKSYLDLVTHIEEPETKEEPMNTVTVNNVPMTYAQIEAAHAEMMRQKAENEIKVGDIVLYKSSTSTFMFIADRKKDDYFANQSIAYYHKDNLEKVTGNPEFMAQLREKLEGK